LEAGPSGLADEASTFDVDCPAAPRLDSPVTAVNVGVVRSKLQIQPAFEQPLDIGPEPGLIVLESEHVVGSSLSNCLCNRSLAAHRVDCDNTPLQRKHFQKGRNRLNLAQASLRAALPEHYLLPRGPSLYQVQLLSAGSSVPAPPSGLPVERYDFPIGLLLHPARPGPETALKGGRINLPKHPTERVVRGNSSLVGQQPPKPFELRFPKLFERDKIVGPTGRSANRKKHNLLNRIQGVARTSRILDLGETVDERCFRHHSQTVGSRRHLLET
jgi:hypothetical protein